MQVVLFCGSPSVRMRDYTKPTDAESFLQNPWSILVTDPCTLVHHCEILYQLRSYGFYLGF